MELSYPKMHLTTSQMGQWVQKTVRQANCSLRQSPSLNFHNHVLFAVFCICIHWIPLFAFIPEKGDPHFWTLSVRICAQICCMILLLMGQSKPRHPLLQALFFHAALMFCVPFLCCLMFLTNASSLFWFGNFCLSAFLLGSLQTSKTFVATFIGGIILAIIIFYSFDPQASLDWQSIFYIIYVMLFSASVGIVFSLRREKETREKINSLRKLSATVAHEMRTPLATLSLVSQVYEKSMPKLSESYRLSQKIAPKDELFIEPRVLNYMLSAPKDLYAISRRSLLLIDSLLKNFRGVAGVKQLKRTSVKSCVTAACAEYAFDEKIFLALKFDIEQDFEFYGDQTLFVHVLINLISNSVRHLLKFEPGAISIWTRSFPDRNILFFRDRGNGISQQVLGRLLFLTGDDPEVVGTGLGLSFCNQVMAKFNGQLCCESDGKTYTQFSLAFPKIS